MSWLQTGAAPPEYFAHLAEFATWRSLFGNTETVDISGRALSASMIHMQLNVGNARAIGPLCLYPRVTSSVIPELLNI